MKIKNLFYPLSLAMAAMTLTACSSTEGEEAVTAETAKAGQTGTFQVSINVGPAETRAISVGGNNGQTLYTNWDQNDAVQVVKDGTSVGTLTADVSAGNTAYATLTGTLSGTFAVNDQVTLYYHSADIDYTGQKGTLPDVSTNKSFLTATSTVQEFGQTTGTISDNVGYLVMSNASYSPMQAYLDISFTDADSKALAITQLDIWTSGGKLVKTAPLVGEKTYATEASPLTITPDAATDHFFLALRDEAGASNTIYFKATTATDTYNYSQESNLAIGGYYYAASPKAMTGYRIKPTITRGDGGTVPEPDAEYYYYWLTPNGSNPIDVTLSGTSKGYYFYFTAAGTVHLNSLQAEYDGSNAIIQGAGGGLTIDIAGDNSVISTQPAQSITVDSKYNLYLRGNGTLTVSGCYSPRCGLYGKNYQNGGDPSVLAADGYTVTRSDATAFDTDNNGSTDYYTWTYTVTPLKAAAEATASDIGKVIGGNGKIYETIDAATTDGTTAEAMIAFVGNVNGECTHGLAISLTDAYEYNVTFAQATGENIIPVWATLHPIAGGTWRLPTEADLQRMIWGYYVANPEGAAEATSAAKTVLTGGYYWTSTEIDGDNAKGMYYDGTTYASVQSLAKTETCLVRACLAF